MIAQQQLTPKPAMPAVKLRMTLASVTKGKIAEPITVLVFGVEGVGKSTFGSDAPNPIFLDGERGSSELNVARFPVPETWSDVREALRVLAVEPHEYKTLVIDTLDWLEPLIWKHICARDKQPDIESYGYGKGYSAALDEWRVFLADIERVRARGLNIVLLAHSWIRPFKNPLGDDFDRYEMKLNAKAGGLLKEWPKSVLFANYETTAAKDARTKRVRGVSTGARILYTTRTAAYDAKNRYGLPDQIPLSWTEFEEAVKAAQPASVNDLISEIERKSHMLGEENKKRALDAIERAAGDVMKLAKLNSWCNCHLCGANEVNA
jgi:hypothetical protein